MTLERFIDRPGLDGTVITDLRRKAPRKAVFIPGEISFGDRKCRVDCRILDLSATGARLSIGAVDNRMKQRVGLYFERSATNVECQVVWINDGDMGVQFCSAFQRLVEHK